MTDAAPRSEARSIKELLSRMLGAIVAVLVTIGLTAFATLWATRATLDSSMTAASDAARAARLVHTTQMEAGAAFRARLIARDDVTLAQFSSAMADADDALLELEDVSPTYVDTGLVAAYVKAWRDWAGTATPLAANPPAAAAVPNVFRAQTAPRFAIASSAAQAVIDDMAKVRREREEERDHRILLIQLVTPAVVLLASLGLGWYARRVGRRISEPLVKLRGQVSREGRGLATVPVSVDEGPREVLEVADAFTLLQRRQDELQKEAGRTLDLHRTTNAVAQIIGAAGGENIDWNMASRVLGRALGADGVAVHLVHAPAGVQLSGFWVESSAHSEYMLNNDEVRSQVLRDVMTKGDDVILREGASTLHDGDHDIAALFAPALVGRDPVAIVSAWARGGRQWSTAEIQASRRFADLASRTIAEHRFVETLIDVDRQKSEFVATTSHELRTPLTSIAGYLEMLVDGDFGAVNDQQRRALNVMDRNVARLRGLIEDLLALNRIELGRGVGETQLLDLPLKVKRVCESLQPLAIEAAVTLELRAMGETKIRGDRDQVERALTNVIANAIKFTPPHGRVTVSCTEAGRSVTVSVVDTGVGIPEAEISSIFTRFFRASNVVQHSVPGTGLGLAITRGIVEAHGGQIRISSVENEGTTVELMFPMAEPRIWPR